MNKNTIKIAQGLKSLAYLPVEIISGSVVAGSYDDAKKTISVQPPDNGEPITGVRLSAITESDDGVILEPADHAAVVIGSIDGPGEWVLLRTNTLNKVTLKLGNINCSIDAAAIKFVNSNVLFNMDDATFKLNTSSESLCTWLKDLITKISAITVATGTGTSSVPNNISDFTTLTSRLDNLLSS